MAYKLLALDMDGTLLDSAKRVSPNTAAAIADLAGRGVAVAYCSGRCLPELLDFPRELPFIRYGVLSSGTVVHDFSVNKTIGITTLDPAIVEAAVGIGRREEVMVHVLAREASVVSPDDMGRMDRFGMGVYRPMYERVCTLADDPVAWAIAHPGEVVKLNLYHLDAEARDRTHRRLEAFGLPVTLANAEETSVELSPVGVSKAAGLETLASYLGATMADVVAVGDSDNDLAALSSVGMPVAMGNATDAVLEVARLVVADNDHDGIVEAIGRLF